MSGHSKWATTKRQKAVTDSKRASLFTKLARNITVAAKEGGADPEMNFKLRIAIDKAKEGNMPKDNIERAVERGAGKGGEAALEQIIYEGFGPGGSAFMVEALTDNRNRSSSSIKHVFTVGGGSLGSTNSVAWMFEKVGGIKAELPVNYDKDDVELKIIEAGAKDFEWLDDKTVWVYTEPTELQKVKEALEAAGLKTSDSEIGYKSKETILPDKNIREKIEKMYEALDEDEDVQNFWSNAAI